MPHEYDFLAFLRGLSEAQARADEKTLAAQESDALLCEEARRGLSVPLRNDVREVELLEDRSASDLRALLKFLGEE